MRLACACAAVLTMAATAVALASSSPRLTPAMEATIRAVIEAQLEKRPEMRFNTTRLREIQDRAGKADSTNDDTPLMIAKMGYPSETHEIITQDGYILNMHRIPFGKKSPLEEGVKKPAIYLQHGLLCSSADWVMWTEEKSLGYVLADAGFDVWIGNYRGNSYSRNHETLDPDFPLINNPFWDFSWDQDGIFDIPAMIDYVLEKTGQEKLHYVGHSMGTTGFFVAMDHRPEYQDKVIMAHLLAPVAYVENMISPISWLAPFIEELEFIFELISGEFLPDNGILEVIMSFLAEYFCGPDDLLQGLCKSVIFFLCGFDDEQFPDELLPTIMQHTPAGSSVRQVSQYAQEVVSAEFCRYDYYDEALNYEHYDQATPPLWNIGNVNVPIATYYGANDWLCAYYDYERMLNQIPNLYEAYTVEFPKWNHLDFLWAKDIETLLFPKLLENIMAGENMYQDNISSSH